MNLTNSLKIFLLSFLLDAASYSRALAPQEIVIQVANLEKAEGKSEKVGGGWLITIDSGYYEEFNNRPEVIKKLIYHELGHIYLNLKDNDDQNIMNSGTLYTRLKDKDLRYLFEEKPDLLITSDDESPSLTKEEICEAIQRSDHFEYKIDSNNETMVIAIKLTNKK